MCISDVFILSKSLQSMHHKFIGVWGSFITGQGQNNLSHKIISISEGLWGKSSSRFLCMRNSHKRVHCALQWRCCQVGANALFNFSTQSHQVVCVTVLQLKRSVRQGSRDTDRRQGDRVKIWKCYILTVGYLKFSPKSEMFSKIQNVFKNLKFFKNCHQKLS